MSGGPLARQRGASLVELMVAMAIGAVVVAAMVMLYMQTGRAFTQQQAMADLQARGRLVTRLVSDDLRRSGFWGEVINPARPNGSEEAGFGESGFAPFAIDNALPVWGGSVAQAKALDLPGADSMMAGSQAVAARYANNRIGPCLNLNDDRMLVTSSASAGSCERWRLAQAFYHLREVDGGAPALYVTRLGNNDEPTTSEVVRYVERLDVEWGRDLDDDGAADRFYTSAAAAGWTIADWQQVVAARLYVLVRSERPVLNAPSRDFMIAGQTYTFDDGYLRRLFVTTSAIRNNRLRQFHDF